MFGQWHVYSLEMTPGTHISSSLLFILDENELVQAEEKLVGVGVAADTKHMHAAYSLLALSSVGNRISVDQWKGNQLKIYEMAYPA